MKGIIHIPHASTYIPSEYLGAFYLSKEELDYELLLMTDHFTHELFSFESKHFGLLSFPVSRLLVDPERFESDDEEIMSKVGMGCIYKCTHDGRPLKEAEKLKTELIEKFYKPHHLKLHSKVEQILGAEGSCLIIDCHSFPKIPLPYELCQNNERGEICIGTDDYHTPKWLSDFLVSSFQSLGFLVTVNEPFSGSIVPKSFWRRSNAVSSIMIEVRRDLYMNELTGKKSKNFVIIKKSIEKILVEIEERFSE